VAAVPVVLVLPTAAVIVAAGVAAWLAHRAERSLDALRTEVDALAQLRAARDLLAVDLDRTRRTFGGWPSGPDR